MGRIYRPPRHLFDAPESPHRRLGSLFRVILDGRFLVLGFLRIQFKLPLPRIRPLFVEVLEVFDKKRLGHTRLEVRNVHDLGRGV